MNCDEKSRLDEIERRIQQRVLEASATAQDRYARIATAGVDLEHVSKVAFSIASDNMSVRSKVTKMYKLVDETMDKAAPHLSCKSGCSGCCKIPVVISLSEAKRIEAGTGIKPVAVKDQRDNVDTGRYTGNPCTFLSPAGLCKIYEHRPLACRGYATLDIDELLCNAQPYGRQDVKVYHLDFRSVDFAMLSFLYNDVFADIRDFFPSNANA